MLLPRYGLPSPFSNSNEIIHPRNRIGSHFRRTKDPEKDEDFVKGETRERAPEALLLSPRGPIRPIDDEIKANAGLDRDSKSSRNVPQRLRYAFTIGISVLFPFIFFFSFTQVPCTLLRDRRFFDCTNFTWKHQGQRRRETSIGKTIRTSLPRYLSIFHFEHSIIGGVSSEVTATKRGNRNVSNEENYRFVSESG